jgi:hypothetical protein
VVVKAIAGPLPEMGDETYLATRRTVRAAAAIH